MNKIFLSSVTIFYIGNSALAGGRCAIRNDSKVDFKIDSGSTYNQSVDYRLSTTIDEGKIKGKSKDGKHSIDGQCKNGDKLEIIEKNGVPVLIHK